MAGNIGITAGRTTRQAAGNTNNKRMIPAHHAHFFRRQHQSDMYHHCNHAGYGRAHWGRTWGMPYRRPKYNVPVNIAEHEDAWEISVYATGFDKADIRLSVSDETLYITGTREAGDPAPQFIRQEFPVKSFERIISLNGQVDTTRITARQEGSVLYITLPKTEAAKSPEVSIPVS
jgi:HSP20 family protein